MRRFHTFGGFPIRALVANPADTVEARVNASSFERSPSRNDNGRAQPALASCPSTPTVDNFQRHATLVFSPVGSGVTRRFG